MKIWIARHGQTRLNKEHLMQGRTDEPLNETGIRQAENVRERIGMVPFDAVYASPLDRAITTGAIISGFPRDRIVKDSRIIEADFGKYELHSYYRLSPSMKLYWLLPELFPAPESVETIASMVKRSSEFLRELEQKEYDNVLVSCHGGIMRALTGYLIDKKNGIYWRPKPTNCEVRVFESENGSRRRLPLDEALAPYQTLRKQL